MCTHANIEMNPQENEWFDKMEELLKSAPEETAFTIIANSGSNSCKGRAIITVHGKTPDLMAALTLAYEKAPDVKMLFMQSISFSNFRTRNPLSDFFRKH